MRPLEYVLTLSLVFVYCWLTIPRLRQIQRLSYCLQLTLMLALMQWIGEGYRWQMIPAYLLSVWFTVVWIRSRTQHTAANRSAVRAIVASVLTLLAVGTSIALPVLVPVFELPKPTGPYNIGTITYQWTDSSRPELFSVNPDDHRQIVAQVWYPAAQNPSVSSAPYVQDAVTFAPALARLFGFPGFFFDHFKYVTSHAQSAAAIATDKPNYPVLIFLSGLNGYRQMNMFQVEDLVSHGYVVVGLDQPGTEAAVTLSDGSVITGRSRAVSIPLVRQSADPQTPAPLLNGTELPNGIIGYTAQDISFAIDQLANLNSTKSDSNLSGRLNLAQLGAFGISLGGMNVAQACHDDARLKACLIMDVYMPAAIAKYGLKQPTMFMSRPATDMRLERERAGGWSEADIALTIDSMKATYNKLQGNGYYLDIAGMFHLNFTDIPTWSPITPILGLSGPIKAQHGFDIVNDYSRAFFDHELQNQPSTLLTGQTKPYGEVMLQTRAPTP